jgi:hypothetical protein
MPPGRAPGRHRAAGAARLLALLALLACAGAAPAAAAKKVVHRDHRGKHRAADRRTRRQSASLSESLIKATGGMCHYMEAEAFEEYFNGEMNTTRWDEKSMSGLFHCNRGTDEYVRARARAAGCAALRGAALRVRRRARLRGADAARRAAGWGAVHDGDRCELWVEHVAAVLPGGQRERRGAAAEPEPVQQPVQAQPVLHAHAQGQDVGLHIRRRGLHLRQLDRCAPRAARRAPRGRAAGRARCCALTCTRAARRRRAPDQPRLHLVWQPDCGDGHAHAARHARRASARAPRRCGALRLARRRVRTPGAARRFARVRGGR